MDWEVSELGGGICLLIFHPGDTINRRVNMQLPYDPRRLSEQGYHGGSGSDATPL